MIEMHVYLPEKYMSHFLMEFFFSQKFESLIVSFGPVTWPGWLDLAGLAGPGRAGWA
jgi:nucleoside recognition membrane protein YjiH